MVYCDWILFIGYYVRVGYGSYFDEMIGGCSFSYVRGVWLLRLVRNDVFVRCLEDSFCGWWDVILFILVFFLVLIFL